MSWNYDHITVFLQNGQILVKLFIWCSLLVSLAFSLGAIWIAGSSMIHYWRSK